MGAEIQMGGNPASLVPDRAAVTFTLALAERWRIDGPLKQPDEPVISALARRNTRLQADRPQPRNGNGSAANTQKQAERAPRGNG